MTTVLDRVSVDRISEEAGEIRPGRAAASVIAALLVGLGFVLARVCSGLWLGVAWAYVAVREGWREGRSQAWREAVSAREARRAHAGRPGSR